jgi:hypothetical protein
MDNNIKEEQLKDEKFVSIVTASWETLAALRESNPVEVADYAELNKLVSEPAFKWWVPHLLRKHKRIILKLTTRYQRTEQKFGIFIPRRVREALLIDKETNTTYWADIIKKEVKVIFPSLDVLEHDKKAPFGFQEIPCHTIFDMKMVFKRMAQLVAGGHVTRPLAT